MYKKIKMKKVYLIHRWGGSSEGGWFDWLKKELPKHGVKVYAFDMPNSDHPKIEDWVRYLEENVKNIDEESYFVGHSIGCQTIMRYLEKLPKAKKVGGVIFVAGWFNLTEDTWDDTYTKEIANEWINTPIDFAKVKQHTDKFVLISSDNDPYVPLEDVKLFEKNLGAEAIILKNKGHIAGEDGVTEFPLLLEKILEMSK